MRQHPGVWLFPRAWRARYGEELAQLLDDIELEHGRVSLGDKVDVALAGSSVRASTWWASLVCGRRLVTRRGVVVAVVAAIAGIAISAAALVGSPLPPAPKTAATDAGHVSAIWLTPAHRKAYHMRQLIPCAEITPLPSWAHSENSATSTSAGASPPAGASPTVRFQAVA